MVVVAWTESTRRGNPNPINRTAPVSYMLKGTHSPSRIGPQQHPERYRIPQDMDARRDYMFVASPPIALTSIIGTEE